MMDITLTFIWEAALMFYLMFVKRNSLTFSCPERLNYFMYGVNITLDMEDRGKIKVEGVLWALPVQLQHTAVMRSPLLTQVVLDTGVVTYGGPDQIQIVIPSSKRKMCGLCGNLSGNSTDDTQNPNGNLASDDSIFASSWALSPSGANCSEGCGDFCSVCSSTMAAEFASDNFCGILSAPAGSCSSCHSTVDPQPFFQNCVNDLSLPCPTNSHYRICVTACPESCAILSDIPCLWPCVEGCQFDFGYMHKVVMEVSKLSNVTASTMGITMSWVRHRGLRDAPSSVTALPLPQCAVSLPLALREQTAPLTIPGAVQAKMKSINLSRIESSVVCKANLCKPSVVCWEVHTSTHL